MKLLFQCLLALLAFGLPATQVAHPEDQIIIIEQFIPAETASSLIQFYDSEKQGMLNNYSDNGYELGSIKNPQIRKLILDISHRIERLIQQKFQPAHLCKLDFCGLFSRIERNSCSYHADNIRFKCPIHGENQSQLRMTCDGTCPGAHFEPNHTSWRKYTGLVYLNDDFLGGEILFEDGPFNRKYQKVIPIKAGTLVLTPNSPDFYHEVFPIRKGTRYSLHLWYTDDPGHFFR